MDNNGFSNRAVRHKSKINECMVKDFFSKLHKNLMDLQFNFRTADEISTKLISRKISEIMYDNSMLEYKVLSILDEDMKLINELLEKKPMKHWFQIWTQYTNGDDYTYEAKEFEKIRKVEDEYILLLKGHIDTIELYEDDDSLDNFNVPFKYDYDTLAEIQVRKNENLKEIKMLDGSTGQEYNINYELIDNYFREHSKDEKELSKVNIIDVLGNSFISESID